MGIEESLRILAMQEMHSAQILIYCAIVESERKIMPE